MMGGIKERDFFILDTSASESKNLLPMLKQVVLVRSRRPSNILPGKYEWTLDAEDAAGFYMGRLRCKPDPEFRRGHADLKTWFAFVEPFNQYTILLEPESLDFCIGPMQVTKKDWQVIGVPGSKEEVPEREGKIAGLQCKPFSGVEILGRVIAWFPSPQNLK